MSVSACIDAVETTLQPHLDSGALPGYVAAAFVDFWDAVYRGL